MEGPLVGAWPVVSVIILALSVITESLGERCTFWGGGMSLKYHHRPGGLGWACLSAPQTFGNCRRAGCDTGVFPEDSSGP